MNSDLAQRLKKSLQWKILSQTGLYEKSSKGTDMPEEVIDRVEDLLAHFDCLSEMEKVELDGIMLTNSKIIGTFEKLARMSMYRHLKIDRIQGANKVIAFDAEET